MRKKKELCTDGQPERRHPILLCASGYLTNINSINRIKFMLAWRRHPTFQHKTLIGAKMINIPGVSLIGSDAGIWTPGAVIVGEASTAATQYIFVQNDSNTASTSAWYVTKIDNAHYAMLSATAPKASQYIGAFLRDIATDTTISRLDSTATWTTSDASVVKISSVTSGGQAVISILTAGTATLIVQWGGLTSTLTITAS